MEEKHCNNCKTTKPAEEFHKDSTTKSGLRVFCKVCVNAKRKEYRERNRDSVNEYNKKWLKEYYHSGKGREYHRKYYQDRKLLT